MASAQVASSVENMGFEEDYSVVGVINALERTCELEAKLRQAIQQTHPLTTTLDWDFDAADREREALLAISEQLEYLEDKLREYRFINNFNSEQRAVILSQLDSVRREVVQVIQNNFPRISFGKEIVKEVLAFASAGEDTPRGYTHLSNSTSPTPPRSAHTSPGNSNATQTLHAMVHNTSPIHNNPLPPSSKYNSSYNNDLWDGQENRSTSDIGFLRKSAKPTSTSSDLIGVGSVGPRSRRYSSLSSSMNITDEDIYGPNPSLTASRSQFASKDSTTASHYTEQQQQYPFSSSSILHHDHHNSNAIQTTKNKSNNRNNSNDEKHSRNNQTYGGVLKIRDMLAKAEEGLSAVAEAAEQRCIVPPRILGDGVIDRVDDIEAWDGMSGIHSSMNTRSNRIVDTKGNSTTNTNKNNNTMIDGDYALDDDSLTPRNFGESILWNQHRGINDNSSEYSTPHSSLDTTHPLVGAHDSTCGWSIHTEPSLNGSIMAVPSTLHGGPANGRKERKNTRDQEAHPAAASSSPSLPGVVGKLAGFVFVLGSIAAAATMVATGTMPKILNAKNDHTDVSMNKKKKSDSPPWKESEKKSGLGSSRKHHHHHSQNGHLSQRKGSSSPVRGTHSSSNNNNGNAPVMHVHSPPSSGSFPSAPPDVTAVMG